MDFEQILTYGRLHLLVCEDDVRNNAAFRLFQFHSFTEFQFFSPLWDARRAQSEIFNN